MMAALAWLLAAAGGLGVWAFRRRRIRRRARRAAEARERLRRAEEAHRRRVYGTDRPPAPPKPPVMFARRPETICCPYCWTAQPGDRDICCRCGARFLVLEEM